MPVPPLRVRDLLVWTVATAALLVAGRWQLQQVESQLRLMLSLWYGVHAMFDGISVAAVLQIAFWRREGYPFPRTTGEWTLALMGARAILVAAVSCLPRQISPPCILAVGLIAALAIGGLATWVRERPWQRFLALLGVFQCLGMFGIGWGHLTFIPYVYALVLIALAVPVLIAEHRAASGWLSRLPLWVVIAQQVWGLVGLIAWNAW